MQPDQAELIDFPLSPRFFIAAAVAERPYLGAIADRLPREDDPRRQDCETVLAKIVSLMLYDLRLTYDQARQALGRDAAPAALTDEELALLKADPQFGGVYDIWEAVWAAEDDAVVRDNARYYAALLARLYRLEYSLRAAAA